MKKKVNKSPTQYESLRKKPLKALKNATEPRADRSFISEFEPVSSATKKGEMKQSTSISFK